MKCGSNKQGESINQRRGRKEGTKTEGRMTKIRLIKDGGWIPSEQENHGSILLTQ